MKNINDFYNNNDVEFFADTVEVDMRGNYKLFLEQLLKGTSTLDAGCGCGRDSLA